MHLIRSIVAQRSWEDPKPPNQYFPLAPSSVLEAAVLVVFLPLNGCIIHRSRPEPFNTRKDLSVSIQNDASGESIGRETGPGSEFP